MTYCAEFRLFLFSSLFDQQNPLSKGFYFSSCCSLPRFAAQHGGFPEFALLVSWDHVLPSSQRKSKTTLLYKYTIYKYKYTMVTYYSSTPRDFDLDLCSHIWKHHLRQYWIAFSVTKLNTWNIFRPFKFFHNSFIYWRARRSSFTCCSSNSVSLRGARHITFCNVSFHLMIMLIVTH